MDYRTEHSSPSRVVITATLQAEKVAAEREKIMSSWLKAVRLDGFRKGKAPRALVERRFAAEIRDDLAEGLVRTAFDEVRREEKLKPAGPLDVRRSTFNDDGSFELAVELDVYPRLDLPPFDGFTTPPFDLTPGEAEIDQALGQLRERQAAWEPVENEPATTGLLVEAEVHGSYPDGDGEPFHEERSLFQLGEGEVFPEIEAAVTGHEAGEEVSAERVLGDEAGEERKGKRLAYRVTIKSLRRKRLPEVDDEFARSVGVDAGLATLRERIAARISLEKLRQRREVWREALITYLLEGREFALPDTLVEQETNKELVNLAAAFAERGIDPSKNVDWEKLHPDVRTRVEKRLRAELVLDTAADQLGIVATDAEVDAEVERQAKSAKIPFAELKGNLAKRGGLERIRGVLQRERAVDEILPKDEEGGGA